MESHKFANLFPMMEMTEFNELKKDIKNNGLIEPVTLFEGKILDGRNRFKACKELGIEPTTKEFNGNDPLQFVISTNLRRRHLTASQRVMVARKSRPYFAEQAKKRQGTRTDLKEDNLVELIPPCKARDKLGETFNVSGRYIDIAEQVIEKKPELEEQIISGEKTLTEAAKEIKKEERATKIKEQREGIENGTLKLPEGEFEIIVIDPPWQYSKEGTTYDPDGNRAMVPYPEMSMEELKNIKLPAAKDCVLWLWTTNAFMKEAYELLSIWGFQDKTILTWDKQFLGAGWWLRNITEHCILAIRGEPRKKGIFDNRKHTTLISEKRTKHSEKPESFYKMVNEICTGRKLDYFARKKRSGWEVFGDEINE